MRRLSKGWVKAWDAGGGASCSTDVRMPSVADMGGNPMAEGHKAYTACMQAFRVS